MHAAVFVEPGKIDVAERPDPEIAKPTDAVVRVVLGVRLRLGPLVLPRPNALRGGQAGRPRVHRRGRGRRLGGRRAPQGRPRHRPVRLQRRHLPALPGRHHHELRPRRLLGQRRHRRRPGRGRARPVRRRHPGARPGHRPLRRDDALAARALRRDGHRPSRRGQRRRQGRAAWSPSSATARSASAACSPPRASAPRASSPSAATRPARRSPASSARRTSSPSAATRRPRPSWS